jgi:hypothetical protein
MGRLPDAERFVEKGRVFDNPRLEFHVAEPRRGAAKCVGDHSVGGGASVFIGLKARASEAFPGARGYGRGSVMPRRRKGSGGHTTGSESEVSGRRSRR